MCDLCSKNIHVTPSLNCLSTFVENQLTVDLLRPVHLSFLARPGGTAQVAFQEGWSCEPCPPALFFQSSVAGVGPSHFYIDFRISMSISTKKLVAVLNEFIIAAY